MKSPKLRRKIGRRSVTSSSLPTSSAPKCSSKRALTAYEEASRRSSKRAGDMTLYAIRFAARATISTCRFSRRSRHRRCRHRLCAHRAGPRSRGLRRLDGECSAHSAKQRGINRRSPTPSMRTAPSPRPAPGFTGKRVINDKGEKGDANEAVIKALSRGRHAHRARPPQASVSAFLALEEADHLPQHAAVVHRDGQGHRRSPGDTLRARACTPSTVTRWVPAAGQNRITGMIESRPDWVISRQRAWGVPIAVFVKEKPDGSVDILDDPEVNVRIVEAFEKEGADAWYEPGARERFLGKRANEGWKKVDDILDVWFDSGSTHAFVLEDPVHFPTLAGIKRKVDGGQDTVMYLEGSRPASRLVPFLAAGKLRHARPRALRRGAHARLRARRAGPQDVEVARQRHRAAGRDQAVRRRHPAHVGLRLRLCRRPAHRAGNSQDHGRDLSQAAQHHALDARLAGAFPRGRARQARARCRSWSG